MAIIVGMALAYRAYYRTYRGRRVVDKLKLRTPIFGELLLKVGVARVTRTLSTLLNSGVEIIEAITITAKTSGNAIIEDSILKSRASVQEVRVRHHLRAGHLAGGLHSRRGDGVGRGGEVGELVQHG